MLCGSVDPVKQNLGIYKVEGPQSANTALALGSGTTGLFVS